ncbi:putative mRNA capping nucleoside-triphosphatase [Xylogone sp. PMI_703]|nr:putative mRNA capping nucleoside-triphosphatase [Xylogone sp. PMI_703]
MDLRSIINTDGGDTSVSKPAAPVTPIQPSQGYRDYRRPSQSSSGQHGSQDYGPPSSAPYASPNTYRADPQARPPPPPPLQATSQSDYFSPGGSLSAQSAQSPYRQTPSSAVSTGQYPFPQTFQAPQSPAQHQQYPHTLQRGESYRQSSVPPPHLQTQNPHGSPAPQTPPIGIPGSNPYLPHQRSQSSISTSTPTSAQSQPPQYNQYPQDSPVVSNHPPPQKLSQSQQSQPATPLGPPLQRQSTGGFTQSTSPYQQRGSSTGPFSTFQHTSPEVRTASIPRQPTTPLTSGYDSHRTSTSDPQPKSASERERSLSISPKTRVSGLPGENLNERHTSEDIYINSSKRKTEDQNIVGEELRRFESPQARQGINGNHQMQSTTNSSPHQPPKKRIRYTEPPIWARSAIGRPRRYGPVPVNAFKANGKQLNSYHSMPGPPPAAAKVESNGTRQHVPAAPQSTRQIEQSAPELLGQWEPSILGTRPTDAMTKLLADWIYLKVVSRADIGELSSRGVEVEIEAKLGQLIDSDTNQRYHVPVQSECILAETGRVRFVSSMTESQHKYLNDFLNGKVQETFPGNPEQTKKRVPIVYKHRYERDRFFELPPTAQAHLPAAVRAQLNPRHTVKVRATYDKKDGHLINKIIKARVADLDIYNPQCPLDCRISVNLEMSWDGDLESLITSEGARLPDRNKDRLSYTQSHYQIDLTQVSQEKVVNGITRLEKEHELEIEISTAAVRDHGRRAAMGEQNEYVSLVEGLLDNVRVLARAVPPQ